MVRHRRFLAAVAAAAVALLTVAACSSSGGPTTSTTMRAAGANDGSSTGSTASATGTPIKVGVMCSCSGPFGGTSADGWKVIQAWAESVNAAGGVDGHPIDLVEKDDATNPAKALTNAQALVKAGVAVILDSDLLDEAWAKVADEAKIPVIGGAIAAPLYATDANFYPSGQTNDSVIYSSFATIKQAGSSKIGIIYCAESPVCAESIPQEKRTAQALGVDIAYLSSISATAPNYTAQCLAAKQAGATALFILNSTTIIARVAADCEQQDYHPTYVSEGTGFSDQVLTAPGLKDRLWASFPTLPYFADSPAVAAMRQAVDKYAPGIRTDATTWTQFAAQGWTGSLLFEKAVKNTAPTASDAISAADVVKGLDMIKNETLGGFSPSLTFTAGRPHPVDCWYTARVQGGVAKQVGGQTCHSPVA